MRYIENNRYKDFFLVIELRERGGFTRRGGEERKKRKKIREIRE